MKKLPLLFLPLLLALLSFSGISKPTKSLSRSLSFPVAGSRTKIGGYWGDRRGGGLRKHKGIDVYARKGTPVVAVCDGVIVNRDKTAFGGKTIWLKSGNYGFTAYYAHLDRQLVKDGQYVRKGQVIGTVGNTGNAHHTPSHLHFGISPGGGWVNPLPYVKYAKKAAAKQSVTVQKAGNNAVMKKGQPHRMGKPGRKHSRSSR